MAEIITEADRLFALSLQRAVRQLNVLLDSANKKKINVEIHIHEINEFGRYKPTTQFIEAKLSKDF